MLPLGPKNELARLIEMARQQGRPTLEARLLSALAYIEELEARLDAIEASRRHAGYARAESLTPERRRAISSMAGRGLKATTQTEILPL